MPRGRLPKVGTYTGTAAVLSVELGYRPKAVLILNETDGTHMGIAIDGQTDDEYFKIVDAGAGTTDLSQESSNGVTITSRGFQVGTGLSTSAKVFRYIAF